ncbi:hypothetical protein FA95DRAFT_1552608 [Auriscalpium vulgare]|uniref:Uncharacterized protein n=1 Tax=Auriscalpium vulgare TaxID=40419 RepID=A0ACB8SAA7_9AGAM|nr:hypothetical protein FA95DRAFT_1552608 [Auriscalpium vulgare]
MAATSNLPPGLEGNYLETSTGGDAAWLPISVKKWYTNAFIVHEAVDPTTPGKILLGYKKRGFGAHLYNGFGGKVEPGETPAQAAARELKEECGVEAPLQHCGSLLFVSQSGPEWAFQIEVYRADEYTGALIETDEMRPQWFSTTPASTDAPAPADQGEEELLPIPYDTMWPDDVYWIPLLLSKTPFIGRADFEIDATGKYSMKRWWFGVPPS